MITAVILTRNNQRTLAATLASLTWCDECIVVDDNSFDKTEEIAKSFNTKIFKRSLNDDFAAQRNFGLSKVKGDWVVFVDSDEVVATELAEEIQKSITLKYDGFYMKRRDVLWGKELRHGETNGVRLLRLAKKNAGRWERTVHEVWDVEGTLGELVHPLLHYPHPDVAQFLDSINRYSTLNARVFYSQGKRSNVFEIVAYPVGKFLHNYIWRLGFLDGTPGTIVALMMSFHSFLTRGKLYLLQK